MTGDQIGDRHAGAGDAVIVLGWEMNGITYTGRCAPNPPMWKIYWRRIVATMRSVDGARFRFDFAPSRGRDAIPWTECYPGDDVVDIIGMHRSERYFAEPLRFDPGRFSPEAEKAIDKYAYVPFGGGPRVCIGNHFAMLEAQLALSHLVQKLRFDLLPESESAECDPLITLRPKHGVRVRVTNR